MQLRQEGKEEGGDRESNEKMFGLKGESFKKSNCDKKKGNGAHCRRLTKGRHPLKMSCFVLVMPKLLF